MDNTEQFVEQVRDRQRKDTYNKTHQGKGNPGRKIPGKQHSTDK